MTDAPTVTVGQAKTSLQAVYDAIPGVMLKLQGVENEETILSGVSAGLMIGAVLFPPAALLADAVKVLQVGLLLHALGFIEPGQPGDPAMDRAAGHSGMGGR